MKIPALLLLATLMFQATPTGLDPKIMTVASGENPQWRNTNAGVRMAVLSGDPDKAVQFSLLVHWKAGNMSQPHPQPKDRTILVLEGTCWMGTGDKFLPDSMVPYRKYTTLAYRAGGMHFDGAKQEDCWTLVTGEGPIVGLPPVN